jgi:hypothetical protein
MENYTTNIADYGQELKDHNGIYIFFDSRGRAIYAGKAVQQKLWSEIKSAFNRQRGEVQTIKRVAHPNKNYTFRRSEPVALHAIAAYLSAYAVPIGLVSKIEALLVRGFANDLLNTRMESILPRKTAKKA